MKLQPALDGLVEAMLSLANLERTGTIAQIGSISVRHRLQCMMYVRSAMVEC